MRVKKKELQDGETLKEEICGIKDPAEVDFRICVSEDEIASELVELLKVRDMTLDELGLLFCYKHGMTVNQALEAAGTGFPSGFHEFVKYRL